MSATSKRERWNEAWMRTEMDSEAENERKSSHARPKVALSEPERQQGPFHRLARPSKSAQFKGNSYKYKLVPV